MLITKKNKKRGYVFFGLLLLVLLAIGVDNYTRQFNNQLQHNKRSAITKEMRVFTTDWKVSVPLMAMNHPPVAITDKRIYSDWVGSPKIPDEMIDFGTRSSPNPELMVQLEIDLFIDTDFYEEDRSIYNPGVPVKLLKFHEDSDAVNFHVMHKWSDYASMNQQIGRAINQSESTDKYIEDSRLRIIEAGNNIRKILGDDKIFLVVSIDDDRVMSVKNISDGSSLALDMMGLKAVSLEQPNLWTNFGDWGWSNAPFHKILELPDNTCLIVAAPVTALTEKSISKSLIWQRTVFSKKDACIYKVRNFLLGGGIQTGTVTELVTFAEELEAAVSNPQPIFHLRREDEERKENDSKEVAK